MAVVDRQGYVHPEVVESTDLVVQPVTLTLRKGNPASLDTVGILADGIATSYYEWKVSDTLGSAR